MKAYLIDGAFGLAAAVIFFGMYIAGYSVTTGLLLGLVAFLGYTRTPFYEKRHGRGMKAFSLACLAFFFGVVIGALGIFFLAAFSITQWSLAF